jgi:hypothetical protein
VRRQESLQNCASFSVEDWYHGVMAFDRKDWSLTFDENDSPLWPCPHCKRQSLKMNPDSVRIVETTESRSSHNHPAWEVEWIAERFTSILECASCHEPVSLTGYATTHELLPDGSAYSKILHPLFVVPPVEFFRMPSDCPAAVQQELLMAFSVFWCSPGAGANHIRISLEYLMDHLRVRKKLKTKKGAFHRLSLHDRLELFKERDEELGSSLLAVKWIGNTGSHKGQLTQHDLFDAFEILDHVLDELFLRRSRQVAALTRAINKSKGPRSVAERRRLARVPPPF